MESVIEASENNLDELSKMGVDLWPEDSYETLKEIFYEIIQSENKKVFLAIENGKPSGFIFVSVRRDYVEGSDTSPTGYVEGIYVKNEFRKTGMQKNFLPKEQNGQKKMAAGRLAQMLI